MKNSIKFVTTFSKTGYKVYGKNWIEKFIKNTSTEVIADIYVDFDLNVEHERINIINFNENLPQHKNWKNDYELKSNKHGYIKLSTIKFSHKAFVISHCLLNSDEDFVIWLDGDASVILDEFIEFPKNILSNEFVAVQREYAGYTFHCESGILVFNNKHQEKQLFAKKLLDNYLNIETLNSMPEPYDGFVIWKTINDNSISYIDLNAQYGRGGIQSDPNETFLHPEIKKRFIHNIGFTGKTKFENFEKYRYQDEMFLNVGPEAFYTELSSEIRSVRSKILSKKITIK